MKGPTEIIDLTSDDECDVGLQAVKPQSHFAKYAEQQAEPDKVQHGTHICSIKQEAGENRNSSGPTQSTDQIIPSVLKQGLLSIDNLVPFHASPIAATLLCRQFWKAGNNYDGLMSKIPVQSNLIALIIYYHTLLLRNVNAFMQIFFS